MVYQLIGLNLIGPTHVLRRQRVDKSNGALFDLKFLNRKFLRARLFSLKGCE